MCVCVCHVSQEFVDEVMTLVELGPQAGALVGLPGQFGLSVEQRKRLTIGVELVANPSVVFMDEPTSGKRHTHTHTHTCAQTHAHTYTQTRRCRHDRHVCAEGMRCSDEQRCVCVCRS